MGMAGDTLGARGDEIEFSVVVPVYGCADCLVALHDRLDRSVAQITDRYEFVFVDDRSLDDGWAVLRRLARADPHVRAFRLSRNFGQDAAITAGLAQARGEWAVVMDCDLQEAPEDIPRLWAAAGEGYDIVRTVRRGWSHSAFRRWTSRAVPPAHARDRRPARLQQPQPALAPGDRRLPAAARPRPRVHDRARLARVRLDGDRDRASRAPRREERLHARAADPGRARRHVLPQHGAAAAGRARRVSRGARRARGRGVRDRRLLRRAARRPFPATRAWPCCCSCWRA